MVDGTTTAASARISGPTWSPLRMAELMLVTTLLVLIPLAASREAREVTAPDFVATWTGIEIVAEGDGANLYDLERQTEIQRSVYVGSSGDPLPYLNPPSYLLPFLPLSPLSFHSAFMVVALVNIGLVVAWALLVRRLMGRRAPPASLIALVALLFFPTTVTVLQGQNSAMSLLLLTAFAAALVAGRPVVAGVALGALAYKPQLLVVIVALLAFKRQWRTLGATMVTAGLSVAVSYVLVGASGMRAYLDFVLLDSPLETGRYGINPERMHNWRGFTHVLFGPDAGGGATIVVGAATLLTVVAVLFVWRGPWEPGTPRFSLQLAATLAAALLVSPHLNTHDLMLTLLVGALVVHGLSEHRARRWLAPTIVVGALVVAWESLDIADATTVQPSALCLAAVVVAVAWTRRGSLDPDVLDATVLPARFAPDQTDA